MLLALTAVLVASLAVQLLALWGMGRRRPIGDEVSYLARGSSEDPHAPRLFLRPPVLPWLAALCCRDSDGGENRLRLLMALTSFFTVVLTALAGWWLGGLPVALVAACLLAAQPERILIGCHIWPDTLLAFTLAALSVVLVLPANPALAVAASALGTFGLLIRVDFLLALPLLLAAWSGSSAVGVVAALLGPPLLALVMLSVRNRRRYRMPVPDTTWAFNIMVARSEARRGDRGGFEIEGVVRETVSEWQGLAPREISRRGLTALGDLLRSPRRFGRGIARRLLTMVGPDTFIRQKLLPAYAAYPDLGEQPRQRWEKALKIAFPLLAALVLVTAAASGRLPGSFAWPSLGLPALAVLFHARTRYRVAMMPAFSLVAAQEIVRHGESLTGRPLTAALILLGVAVAFWALLQIRCSDEHRAESLAPRASGSPDSAPQPIGT